MNERKVVEKAHKAGAAIECRPWCKGVGYGAEPWLDAGDHLAVWGFSWDTFDYRVVVPAEAPGITTANGARLVGLRELKRVVTPVAESCPVSPDSFDSHHPHFNNSTNFGGSSSPSPVSDITNRLIDMLGNRDAFGMNKYGTSLDRTDLTPEEWLQHMTEELLDGAGYAQCLLRDIAKLRDQLLVARAVVPDSDGLAHLQATLPWTIRYSQDFRSSPITHKDFAHALTHIGKAAGKLHELVDDMDHDKSIADSGKLREEYGKYVADLVVCALRMANTMPGGVLHLGRAVVDRIASKNAPR